MLEKIINTANFLYGFEDPDKYKFLTHKFDPLYKDDFYYYVNLLRQDLIVMRGLIPDTLYDLLFGFLFGPSWSDADGEVHTSHCSSQAWLEWCKSNCHKHPKEFFIKDFKAFKNSFRVYAGDFGDYIEELADGRYAPLNITQDGLNALDCYLDVGRLRFVLDKIISLMSDPKHSSHNKVVVSLLPRHYSNGFIVETISIEQYGSFDSKPIEDVIARFEAGAGDLATIKNAMMGYFGWSIESKWQNIAQRWNIIHDDSVPNREPILREDATGFRNLIRIYHKKGERKK